MTIAATSTEQLADLLAEQQDRRYTIWSSGEADRLRMRAAWEIGVTAPGNCWGGERLDLSALTHCTSTVFTAILASSAAIACTTAARASGARRPQTSCTTSRAGSSGVCRYTQFCKPNVLYARPSAEASS